MRGVNIDVFTAMLIRKLFIKTKNIIERAAKSDFWELYELRNAIDVEIGHLQTAKNPDYDDLILHPDISLQ